MKNICANLKNLHTFLHKIPGWVWLIPILILATHVRLLYLTKADIWHDEGYTAAIIKQPLIDIISSTTTDVHPPFYYIIMHFWQLLFEPIAIAASGGNKALAEGIDIMI